MKAWKCKIYDEKFGICTVKEASDDECMENNKYAPISHGFVNLFKNGKFIDWCGVNFASDRIITSLSNTVIVNSLKCDRCGKKHYNIQLSKLKKPNSKAQYWAMCPTTFEPILI